MAGLCANPASGVYNVVPNPPAGFGRKKKGRKEKGRKLRKGEGRPGRKRGRDGEKGMGGEERRNGWRARAFPQFLFFNVTTVYIVCHQVQRCDRAEGGRVHRMLAVAAVGTEADRAAEAASPETCITITSTAGSLSTTSVC